MATAKKATSKTTTDKDTTEPVKEVVVKMTRLNPVFEISNPATGNKYRFTQASPYVLVEDELDVNFLLRLHGMELATPQQVADYYGK